MLYEVITVYTAMTIGEYYRSMGLRVLLMADSTSRWAQALREMSNRLEELPGPDAFPMDLSAIVSNFYARAGFVYLNNGETASITFIGTVSPAGGNLKEPVTESTRKAARCFYGLSQASRITSYNVCYTKLLRLLVPSLRGILRFVVLD